MTSDLIEELFKIRSRRFFTHEDIRGWVVRVFEQLLGIPLSSIRAEVSLRGEPGKYAGRIDVFLEESIIVEIKRDLRSELSDAENKLNKYAEAIESGDGRALYIATDGELWRFYIYDRLTKSVSKIGNFTVQRDWDCEKLAYAISENILYLREEQARVTPSPETIVELFGPNSACYHACINRISEIALNDLNTRERSRFIACFSAWLEIYQFVYPAFRNVCNTIDASKSAVEIASKYLLRISEKIKKVNEGEKLEELSKWLPGAVELFLRHTYLATLVKLLLTATQIENRARLYGMIKENPEDIVNGNELRKNHVYIVDRDDFFSWITSDKVLLSEMLRFMANKFSRLKLVFKEDIFRRIYEEIVDEATRHQLGEYYTPRWIAEYLAKKCIGDENARILDPACGSGTFLAAAIRRKYELGLKDLNKLLEDVWGVDINPLSVLIAKAVVYLTLFGLEERGPLPTKIMPNVYVGDSLALYRAEIKESKEALPKEIKKEGEIYVKISENLLLKVMRFPENLKLTEKVKRFKDIVKDIEKAESEYGISIREDIQKLREIYGDNVWYTILNNHLIIPLLENEFDVVLGNPPWLVYREAGKLQSIMDYIAESFGVKPPAKAKTSFNLAFVFMIASMRFLRKRDGKVDGVIGFVVPPSITELAHYRVLYALAYRENGINGMRLKSLEDFSEIKEPPFPHGLGASIIIIG